MKSLQIKPRAPFDFAATARFLRFSETEIVDTFTDHTYRRAVHLKNRLHLLSVTSNEDRQGKGAVRMTAPTLSLKLETTKHAMRDEMNAAVALVERIFSTHHDLKKFRARIAHDPFMSNLEKAHRGLHLTCWPTLFEALVISILSQQISTVVAMTLKRRLVEKFGETLAFEGKNFYAFPRAESLAGTSVEELRALGISGAKALSIIEAARHVSAGAFDEDGLRHEENEALIERLIRLRGVGRWTAEWVLLLHFGRTDVFPAGDLALRGFVIKYYNRNIPMTEREIRALAQRLWGEWSSYAALYLLAAMRSGMIHLKRASRVII